MYGKLLVCRGCTPKTQATREALATEAGQTNSLPYLGAQPFAKP